MKHPLRIAVLISGNGSNLQAIIDHQKAHPDLYEIALVLSNKPDAYGLTRARNANIPCQVIDHRKFDHRTEFDAAMQKAIDQHCADLIVLAGFMRILTEEFTRHFLGRMLNIHPSLLPKYPGLNTHQKALDAGDEEHGLSIHFVTPELDGGPVILQSKVSITPKDTLKTLQQKVHIQEHIAYPLVIQWFAEGKLALRDGQVLLEQNPLNHPFQLETLPTTQ